MSDVTPGVPADAQPDSPAPLAPLSADAPVTLQRASGIMWRILVIVAAVFVLVYVLGPIMPVLVAMFFAAVITALATPIGRVIGKVLPRVLSNIIALVIITAGVLGLLSFVVISTANEGPKLYEAVNTGFTQIEDWLKTGPLHLSDEQMASIVSQFQSWAQTIGKGLLADAGSMLGSVGTFVVAFSVFLFALLFFINSPDKIWSWCVSWAPKNHQKDVDTSGRIAWDAIAGYTRGIVIVALADATLVFIGLAIMQVPLAPALAALVFIGAFIPVIGAPIATFFAAVVALAERGPLVALLVVGLTVVVGSFDGDVLQPLVMGKAVNLHPLAIVILIAVGAITMGIIGALIVIPLGSAIYGVIKYYANRDPQHPRVRNLVQTT